MAGDALVSAREATEAHDWTSALEAFKSHEMQGAPLTPADLVRKGDALWWTGRPDEALAVFERAYNAFEREGDRVEAARVAALLAYLAYRRQAFAVANGWEARANRLIEDLPESAAHAWVAFLSFAETMVVQRDFARAILEADDVIALAQRVGLPGIQAMVMGFKGTALILTGEWRMGMELVDEATAIAMSADADLRTASDVYCNTIAACRNLADFRRAGEWTEEAERWMKARGVGGYTGVCQVHRAELKRLHGSWAEAEREARKACVELERFHIMDGLGFAYYEIGEVRRRMGDLDAAEESFAKAYEHGVSAQPGLALLAKDRGDLEKAARSIGRALERRHPEGSEGPPPLSIGWLLPAQVEIALANGDIDTAKDALTQLDEFVAHYENRTWKAAALTSRGSVDVASGRHEDAIDALSQARDLWRESEFPYEVAKTRVLLGRAHAGLGEDHEAEMEYRAARSTLQKLGARADLRELEKWSGPPSIVEPGDRITKTFMFTDIVTSTDLIGVIGDSAWENLLQWHDRVFREVLAEHDGEEVRHTGDGFFVAFDDAGKAIEFAVTMQRRLEANRRDHGFAPRVRIGIHTAEATKKGSDYGGHGVHAAARVGDLAEGEEILATSEVITAAGRIPNALSEPEKVTLKGISEAVDVHRIEWRASPT